MNTPSPQRSRVAILIMFISLTLLMSGTGVEAAPGLRGQYGFLSDFRCASEAVLRERVRDMVDSFGIREFQFYDWFADYSRPVNGERWVDPFFKKREICLSSIKVYLDEIHRRGGRAWAYVQSVGSEDADLSTQNSGIFKNLKSNGEWHWHEGRFPTYFANEHWADHMVAVWGPTIRDLGFSGIHWDSLGKIAGDYAAERAGFHAFIKRARPLLQDLGLSQTFNFVDMSWWDAGLADRYLEFPYVEAWSERTVTSYYQELSQRQHQGGAVLAHYPRVDKLDSESYSDVMRARWTRAMREHVSYLLIGDGNQMLTGPYFTGDQQPLSDDDKRFLHRSCAHVWPVD